MYGFYTSGKRNLMVVPFPFVLSMVMPPLFLWRMLRTVVRPSPAPSSFFVEK